MPENLNSGVLLVAYLMAGVLFIRSLAALSKQETARQGNIFGVVGMGLAVVVASLVAAVLLFGMDTLSYQLMVKWLPMLWSAP